MSQTLQQLTWDEVLERKDLIGGDIESVEDGVPYRGPLSKMEMIGNMIHFTSPWSARLNSSTGDWERWDVTSSSINKELLPQSIDGGRILFHMPFIGPCTIYPINGNKLDANKVKGLPKNSERFLALFPDLPFDRQTAEKILVEKSFVRTFKLFNGKPANATLRDLLDCIKHDGVAEEFLWHYVEAITDETSVHEKVY